MSANEPRIGSGGEHTVSGIARHSYLFQKTPYSIRDSVYGSIPLSEAAYATLDTPPFQRLKHVKQLGLVYLVYPGATHTRFSHCIGVYHLARLALQHLISIADIDPEVGRAALAAAMLHDIGHFPLSHVIDEITIDGRSLSHSQLSVRLVNTDDDLRQVLQDKWDVDPVLVADIVGGRPNPRIPRFLYTLLDGPIDIDKLDYLNRDAHHAGVPYGYVEVQRLIDFLAVDPHTQELVIRENGIGTVESVIFAKYLMFRYVYWHHTVRIAAAMVNRAVLDVLLALGINSLDMDDPRIQLLCTSTDAALESTLRALLHEAGVEPPPSLELLGRVDERRLYKRAFSIPSEGHVSQAERYRDALKRRRREVELSAAMTQLLDARDRPIQDHDLLIDVPTDSKLQVDVGGILVEGDEDSRVLDWESAPLPSYFTRATVAAMEQRIRTILYICNLDRPRGADLQRALRSHPELL